METKDYNRLKDTLISLIRGFEMNTRENTIKGFELVLKICESFSINPDELATHLVNRQDVAFNFLNTYFRKAHTAIRDQALESVCYHKNLEAIALNNYRENTGYYYGKEQYMKAYSKLLDNWDPNIRQEKENNVYNWDGFSSLIETHQGKITGVILYDTIDIEYFYSSLTGESPDSFSYKTR